jgi:hypothetical protein
MSLDTIVDLLSHLSCIYKIHYKYLRYIYRHTFLYTSNFYMILLQKDYEIIFTKEYQRVVQLTFVLGSVSLTKVDAIV